MKVIEKLDNFLMKVEEIILSYAIIVIALMVIGNVINRSVFGSSWSFAEEISRFSVILATFMGIGYAARKGRHINMSAFFDLAPYPIKKALSIFIPFVTSIVLFALTYYSYIYLMSVHASGRVTPALQLPVWVMMLFVPVGLFLGGVQFLRNMWVNIKNKEVYLASEKKDYS
ncbi:TRAP transporter small permease [Bacillus tianshenii]|nr:TRAP transporter small permease [Bacillus tianshenii]